MEKDFSPSSFTANKHSTSEEKGVGSTVSGGQKISFSPIFGGKQTGTEPKNLVRKNTISIKLSSIHCTPSKVFSWIISQAEAYCTVGLWWGMTICDNSWEKWALQCMAVLASWFQVMSDFCMEKWIQGEKKGLWMTHANVTTNSTITFVLNFCYWQITFPFPPLFSSIIGLVLCSISLLHWF